VVKQSTRDTYVRRAVAADAVALIAGVLKSQNYFHDAVDLFVFSSL
jgi:hypothetical protein